LDERLERLNAPRQLRDFGSRYRHASRSIKFREIAGDALVDRCEPPLKPLAPEVLFAVVHGLELAAVNREAGVVTQVQVPQSATSRGTRSGSLVHCPRRKSAMVLKSGHSSCASQISSTLRWHSRSNRRDD
jgi:hypothetical protein